MLKSLVTIFLIASAMFLPAPQRAITPSFPFAPETWQQEMLRQVNQVRRGGCRCGRKNMPVAKPLKWNEKLAQAAKRHASDMDKNHFIGHHSSDGSRIGQRVDAAGYNWQCVAENVAWNVQSVQDAIHGWKDSPGHCLNMMGGYTDMGAARAGNYWVQVFASPMK